MIPISYNLRNIAVRRTTSLATALGIGLVVFVLASAMMLTEGLKKTLDQSGSPDTAIVMRRGSDGEMSSSIQEATVGIIKSAPGVKTNADGQPLAVGEVIVVMFMKMTTVDGKSNVQLRGVPDNVMDFRPEIKIVDGRPPRPGTDEVMVGRAIMGRFEGLTLGGQVEIRRNRSVTVVGVFSSDGSSYESEVWGDISTVRSGFGRDGVVGSVRVRLESPAVFDAFQAAIEQDKRLGLMAKRETDFYAEQSENTALFISAVGFLIAAFFSVGAMIGAMITMYGAVANRRSEIGVLRAIGFSKGAILLSFLLESTFLALIGGGIGALAALGMGAVEFSMMNWQTFSEIVFGFEPTPQILLTSVVFGAGMGIAGGFLPAVQAARVSAIQAMRG